MDKKQFKETSTVTKLTLIANIAKERRDEKFTSLMHLLNPDYLLDCFKRLERKKAAGIDGRTVESYSIEEITATISQTIQQMKEGTYKPQPVRKVLIPKANGKTRSLGIPTVTDKIVQLGVARILSAIFDSSFLSASYGYREGKDAHGCLKEVNHTIMQKEVNFIVECDIERFFDHLDHKILMDCISERISDPKFKTLIWKMLKSGVMSNGKLEQTIEGTPQGGIISPVLANIYLHYVLDLWMVVVEKKKLKGYAKLIRYADDFIIAVQYKEEAEQILKDVGERLNKFGLKLSTEKTKIIEFGKHARENRKKHKERKPDTFDFLGFTHYCSKTRDGRFSLKVKTSRKKAILAERSLNEFLKTNRDKEIWDLLKAKLRGHYNYYGVSGNFAAIHSYYEKVILLVYKWKNRRSQKKSFNWEGYKRYLLINPLPKPKLTYALYNTW
jgi:group II intron reverse transcriptase/maturase